MGFLNAHLLKQSDIKDLITQYPKIVNDLFDARDHNNIELYRYIIDNGIIPLSKSVIGHKDFEKIVFPIPANLTEYYCFIVSALRVLGDEKGAKRMHVFALHGVILEIMFS